MEVELLEEDSYEVFGFGVVAVRIEEGIVGAGKPAAHKAKVQ
jgi:hypothetical protein